MSERLQWRGQKETRLLWVEDVCGDEMETKCERYLLNLCAVKCKATDVMIRSPKGKLG